MVGRFESFAWQPEPGADIEHWDDLTPDVDYPLDHGGGFWERVDAHGPDQLSNVGSGEAIVVLCDFKDQYVHCLLLRW